MIPQPYRLEAPLTDSQVENIDAMFEHLFRTIGEPGVTGPTGATGATGDTGATGATGPGITPVYCAAFSNAAATQTTGTVFALNSENADSGTVHSTVTNNSRITAPVTGVYLVAAHGRVIPASSATLWVSIQTNGSVIWGRHIRDVVNAVTESFNIVALIPMTAGDFVELLLEAQPAGGTIFGSATSHGDQIELILTRVG